MAISSVPTRRHRVVRYLYSTKNMVGSGLALGGLGLFFTGVLGPIWPVVVAAMYGIGVLVVPAKKQFDLHADFDPSDIRKALDHLVKQVTGKVPAEIMTKLQGIAETIDGILPRAGELPPGSQELFILQRTALDYLPTSLEHYVNLPRVYASVHPLPGGKTARQLLGEQLDLLASQLNDVADAVAKNDVDRLMAQGRFLEERFGRKDLSIGGTDLPPPPPPAGG